MGVVLLVRHGQASFGAADYDRLSAQGHSQAATLGRAMADRGFAPTHVFSGSMRRQQETAAALLEAAGWALPVAIDPGWDEFDHDALMAEYSSDRPGDSEAFQVGLDAAMAVWATGRSGVEAESFDEFAERSEAALDRVVRCCSRGQNALVVSSAGVISWLTSALVAGGPAQWIALNRVCVNTGVTRIVSGRRGSSMITFNDHSHLLPEEITYR